MRIRKLATTIAAAISLMAAAPNPSFAFEPITDSMLDQADSTAKDIIARAEAAGNSVAKAIGEQLRQSIQALREAVHSTIGDAKEAYLKSENDTYNDISKLLDQAQNLEKVSITDVTTLLASVSNEVGNLPFVNMPPGIMLYQPHVIVPEGNSEIPVHVIGPKLAASNPAATLTEKPVQLTKPRDVELIALLDRKALNFDEGEPRYVPLHIKYSPDPEAWTKHPPVERDMMILLLPKTLGSFTIKTRVNDFHYDRRTVTRHAGGHGRDNKMDINIALDGPDVKDGWKIDVDDFKDHIPPPTRISGDGGASCTGALRETLTEDGFVFRLQHGHKTGAFGKKSDVDVQCSIGVPIVKKTPMVIEGPTLTGNIGWLQDVREPLPANVESYELRLKLFSKREYLIDADNKVPYDVVEISRAKDYVQFRPKPPNDF